MTVVRTPVFRFRCGVNAAARELVPRVTDVARPAAPAFPADLLARHPGLHSPTRTGIGIDLQRRIGEPIPGRGIILHASSRRDWSRKQALTPNVRASAFLRRLFSVLGPAFAG